MNITKINNHPHITKKTFYTQTSRDTPCLPQDHDLIIHYTHFHPKIMWLKLDHTGFSSIHNKIIFPSITIDTPGKSIEYYFPSWNTLLIKFICEINKILSQKYIEYISESTLTSPWSTSLPENTHLRVQTCFRIRWEIVYWFWYPFSFPLYFFLKFVLVSCLVFHYFTFLNIF